MLIVLVEALLLCYHERLRKMKKGKLLVISGPSGSGKSFVAQILKKEFGYALSVSYATRAPRPLEVDGESYHFISEEEFSEKIRQNELLEYAQYTTCHYGTPKEFVDRNLEQGNDVILEIDIQGARQVKPNYPDIFLFMLVPPDIYSLQKRLQGRNDTSEEEMCKRLKIAESEISHIDEYDYIIVNADGGARAAASTINDIIKGIDTHDECRTENNPDFMKHFYKE